jgi:hypothetical protein
MISDKEIHDLARRWIFCQYHINTISPERAYVAGFKACQELMQKRIEELEKQNEIMREALGNWLKWEELQIKKDGEYVGQEINNLINMGREALKKIEEK